MLAFDGVCCCLWSYVGFSIELGVCWRFPTTQAYLMSVCFLTICLKQHRLRVRLDFEEDLKKPYRKDIFQIYSRPKQSESITSFTSPLRLKEHKILTSRPQPRSSWTTSLHFQPTPSGAAPPRRSFSNQNHIDDWNHERLPKKGRGARLQRMIKMPIETLI